MRVCCFLLSSSKQFNEYHLLWKKNKRTKSDDEEANNFKSDPIAKKVD